MKKFGSIELDKLLRFAKLPIKFCANFSYKALEIL